MIELSDLPLASKGRAQITRETPSDLAIMREAFRGRRLSKRPITRLLVGGSLVMSDGDNEYYTNREFISRAHGRVLIAGLGLGLVLKGILPKPQVATVTVIEKEQDVIDLVAPAYLSNKLDVVCSDIWTWRPAKGTKYNVIYFDIWGDMNTDDLREMAKLHRSFARYLDRSDPDCWMSSWCHKQLLRRRRNGQ